MEKSPKPLVMNADGMLVEDTRSPKEITWEKYTTLPFIFLSFIFLLGYSVLILNDEVFTQGIDKYILVMLGVIWITFIIDYFVRLTLSNDKRVFFKRKEIMGERSHHIHLAPAGHDIWKGLAFRDYLRSHGEEAGRYAALKQRLASLYPADRERYTQAKTEFVNEILAKALADG